MNSLFCPLLTLRQAKARYGQREVAAILDINESTLRRWEVKEEVPAYRVDSVRQRILPLLIAPANDDHSFTFIDLFAGIGGIRHGFEQQGGRCVLTSEWSPYAQKTYLANFPHEEGHLFVGDITQVDARDVPVRSRMIANVPDK